MRMTTLKISTVDVEFQTGKMPGGASGGDFRLRPNFCEQIEKKVMLLLLLQKLCNTSDITKSGFEENRDC